MSLYKFGNCYISLQVDSPPSNVTASHVSGKVYHQCMGRRIRRDLIQRVMGEIGAKGGKRSLETMTGEERLARAKKASEAAAKKRTADELAREPASKRADSAKK
jgi:hypothetical protein